MAELVDAKEKRKQFLDYTGIVEQVRVLLPSLNFKQWQKKENNFI